MSELSRASSTEDGEALLGDNSSWEKNSRFETGNSALQSFWLWGLHLLFFSVSLGMLAGSYWFVTENRRLGPMLVQDDTGYLSVEILGLFKCSKADQVTSSSLGCSQI